jgi:hypothetical protein
MTTREIIVSGYYDLVSPAFQCVADAIGIGRIFEFPNQDEDGEDFTVRVLARDSAEAFEILESYRENELLGLPCAYATKRFGVH